MFDGAELGKEIVALVKGYVERQNAALIARIEDLEARLSKAEAISAEVNESRARALKDASQKRAIFND